ncbi:nexilin-like [Schistocerca americana]|uniref:nexilin-like n=1 Tax=Schistocerca americana TaxID=7009 RepID=UPI001F4FA96F|nr:nexilin-like [Schistocerca americana]
MSNVLFVIVTAMFRRMKKFFSRCLGGEKDEGLRLENNLVAVRGNVKERQFTLDSFFEEIMQKRLQEEKEVVSVSERQFTLDAFFEEILQKRLQEEKEVRPAPCLRCLLRNQGNEFVLVSSQSVKGVRRPLPGTRQVEKRTSRQKSSRCGRICLQPAAAMFRRMKKFFSRCLGGEKDEGLRLENNLIAVRGTVKERQFTLDSFFEEILQKRLQEEKEVLSVSQRQFTLDAFFEEILQKRLQEEKEVRPAPERQFTLDSFFEEIMQKRLQEEKEVVSVSERQFTLDAFFEEILQKRLQEEREVRPAPERQFTLDSFFEEIMQKRLQEEKEVVSVSERQFTLDAFFEEILQKRLQEEKEVRPAPERQFTLDAFFVELLQRRLQEED